MKKQVLKTTALAIALTAVGYATQAQTTTGPITKQAAAIRVIDNKGTIKYLQSNNGITQFVNTSGAVTTTTWQLGGELTDNTYIDVKGKAFALDGIELLSGTINPSTDAATNSIHGTGTGTGFTLLVRDEATGATKKLLATDLIQSGQTVFTAGTTGTTAIAIATAATVVGMPAKASQVNVYRNGVKLIAEADYTTAAEKLTLVDRSAVTGSGAWALYPDDVVEVHWFK